jgi:hypothetical protein
MTTLAATGRPGGAAALLVKRGSSTVVTGWSMTERTSSW